MARLTSSRGRSLGGSGFRATPRSGGFRSTGFRPRSSVHIGGYHHHYQPYRRNYFFYRLGPVGKIVYIIAMIILMFILNVMF